MNTTKLPQSGANHTENLQAADAVVKTCAQTTSGTMKTTKGKAMAIIAAATFAIAGCGEAFTAGEPTPDGGVAGEGGAGAQAGGPVGGGAAGGIDGGNAGGGMGGQAGGPVGGGGAGGACDGVPISLNNMAEYEYKITQDSCNGSVIATSLDNGVFETEKVNFCLPVGHNYQLTGQVKDPADNNSFEIELPLDTMITSGKFTTLVTFDPMDNLMANSICTATSGTVPCVDLTPANNMYKCTGNPGVTPPPSSGFILNLDLN